MIVKLPIDKAKDFLLLKDNWPKFNTNLHFKNDSLMIREINGIKNCTFDCNLNNNEITVKIDSANKHFKYLFLLTEIKDVTEINLKVQSQVPYLENLILLFMGIRLAPRSEEILDNLSHFVEFGHIH